MAKAAKKRRAAPAGEGKQQALKIFLMIMMVPLAFFSLPTIVLAVGGLLPTMVAYLIDRGEKYAARCVGGFNLAGLAPYALPLWSGGGSMDASIKILTDPFVMVIIYGAAAIGWLVYIAMPPVIGAFLANAAQRRISTLRSDQQKLMEEWGEDIAR